MKKAIFTFFISFLFLSAITAQHVIGYRIYIPSSCDGDDTKIELASGAGFEGQEFQFPTVKLPEPYEKYQDYINVFAGASIGMPEGSLTENVTLKIDLTAIECGPDYENLKEAFMLTIKVIGSSSGVHDPFSYYYFNEGKKAYLKIDANNVKVLLNKLNMKFEELLAWYATQGLDPDMTGIEIVPTSDYLYIYLKHFSKIMVGVPNNVTGLDEKTNLPLEYKLEQNYPNPFNPTTTLSYSLAKTGYTKLSIYNSIGMEVETLVSTREPAGNYNINFDASRLPSGIYFYTLTSGSFKSTKKMILLK
jgi:hypothetical protein